MINVLKDIPYKSEKMGNRKLVDEDHLLVMQIALEKDQVVPVHKANSNVHLLIIEGDLTVELDGVSHSAPLGSLLPVKYLTSMSIKNKSDKKGSFLVFKTPHPDKITD